MSFRLLVDLIAIAAGVIAVLTYFNISPNAIDGLPERLEQEANKAVEMSVTDIDPNAYFENGSAAFSMYKAAILMAYKSDKEVALSKSIDAALTDGDLKLAIHAVKEMPYKSGKSDQLLKIVSKAVERKETIGYAIIAAELSPYKSTKNQILHAVVSALDGVEAASSIQASLKQKTSNVDTAAEMNEFEQYKYIYNFADNSTQMDMSEEEAKKFTDNWVKNRSFEEFLLYRDVYLFADNSTQMDKNEIEAKHFAFKWIDNGYTKEDLIYFKEVFLFASSSVNMNLSNEDAESFAFSKLEDRRSKRKTKLSSVN